MSAPKNRVEGWLIGADFPEGETPCAIFRMRRAIVTRLPERVKGLDLEQPNGRWRYYRANKHGTVYLDADPRTGIVGRIHGIADEPLEVMAGDWLEWMR